MGGNWQPKILSQEGTKRFIHSFLLILSEPSLSMVYVCMALSFSYIYLLLLCIAYWFDPLLQSKFQDSENVAFADIPRLRTCQFMGRTISF